MDAYTETIKLTLDGTGIKPTSLGGLIAELESVERAVKAVNAAIGGMAAGATRSAAEMEAALGKAGLGGGISKQPKASEVAKVLGLETAQWEKYLAKRAGQLKEYQRLEQSFRSVKSAATAAAGFEGRTAGRLNRAQLIDLLRPNVGLASGVGGGGGGGGALSGGSVAASVSGSVSLVIPASQIVATVAGTVAVGTSAPTGGGGGGGGGKGKGGKGGKGPLNLPPQTGEVGRLRVETDKSLTETITTVEGLGEVMKETHDSIEGIIRTSSQKVTGQTPLAQYRELRKVTEENFKQLKAGIDPSDPGFGLAKLQRQQADQLRGILKNSRLQQGIAPPQWKELSTRIQEEAKTLESMAGGTEERASRKVMAQAIQKSREQQRGGRRAMQEQMSVSKTQLDAALAEAKAGTGALSPEQAHLARAASLRTALGLHGPMLSTGQRDQVEAVIRQMEARGAPPRPPVPKPPKLKDELENGRNRFSRGLASFTPLGFAANFLNVSGWASAVTALYKSVELATYSLHRFLDVGKETAQLSVVFKGVGGNAQELTEDIMKLAAAEGRSTEEALDSAREWARLGLTRKQVNEAVQISLEAANVAEISAREATEKLSAVMHVYGLEVGDLRGVLGGAVAVSQRYNVTVEDLFHGLDRAAGAAKVAGMGIAELEGLIGSMVGKTGQSGIVVGNTVKSILVQFSNPAVQKYLRTYGVEATTKFGEQKSGSEVLRELFVRYEKMSPTERQAMTSRVAGRLQASRFVAMMEGYVEAQRLAIDSQLHLNSAQEANARILGTVKAQLAGVRSEWDRLVVSQMNKPSSMLGGFTAGQALGTGIQFGKNVLGFAADRVNFGAIGKMGGEIGMSAQMASIALIIMRYLNAAMTNRFTGGHEDFMGRMQDLRGQRGASVDQARLFRTVGDLMAGGKGDQYTGLAAQYMGADRGKAFLGSVDKGDRTTARRLLRDAAKVADDKAAFYLREEVQERSKRIMEGEAEKQRLQEEMRGMDGVTEKAGELTKAKRDLADVEGELKELRHDQTAQVLDEEGTSPEALARERQYVALLKEQELRMAAIGRITSQNGLETAGGRLDQEISAARASVKGLEAAYNQVLGQEGVTEKSPYAARLLSDLQGKQGELAALQSPETRELAQIYDRRRLAGRRTEMEAQGSSVGYTGAEKLLREELYLRKELAEVERKHRHEGLNEFDGVRAQTMEVELARVREQIQERIVNLAREEKQIRIEAQREFNKSLLLAGPGEQLQRMYVATLANRKGGISAGQFNALTPEMKRMYYDLQGGEAGAKTREEAALLRGRRQSFEGQAADQEASRKRVQFYGETNEGFLPTPKGMSLPELNTAASRAATNVGAMADAVAKVTMRLHELNAQLSGGQGRPQASVTPEPRLDLSAGHALGAGEVGGADGSSPAPAPARGGWGPAWLPSL